jgi:3-oxoacyl-[acyl-carrier protein] reductase
MVERTILEFGAIDVAVNCAGVVGSGQIIEMPDEEWHRVIEVNLSGTFHVARAVGRQMVQRRSGIMVFIASDRGIYGGANLSNYAASKAGVITFVKSLALELGPFGITANAINPGTTDTPMLRRGASEDELAERAKKDPLGRLSTPQDIAEIVLFLATSGGHFMTGQLITTRMRFG